jgi:DNA-binding CsgD family transcriptional regulator
VRERLTETLGTRFDARFQIEVTNVDVEIALWKGDRANAISFAREALSWTFADDLCADTHTGTRLMLNAMAAAAGPVSATGTEQVEHDAAELAACFGRWASGQAWGVGRPGDLSLVERQIAGELAIATGSGEAAVWEQLAADWLARGLRPRAAYARWREAELRLAAGDRAGATEPARAAFELASAVGWQWVRDGVADLARRARLDIRDHDAEPTGGRQFGLTERESDVLRLLALGRTNRQIADALFISTKTASAHVSSVLAKLGVSNRSEAGAAARRLGLD